MGAKPFRSLVGKPTRPYRSRRYLLNVTGKAVSSIKSAAVGPFEAESETTEVTLTSTVIRAAASNSVLTVVSNTGLHPVKIYEGGALVMVLDSLESRRMPLLGLGVISAMAITSATTVVVTTLSLQ